MIINHNIMAMNTQRQLNLNNIAGAKSTEKLSSGYRINRAGDDAAGLAISEKMRGQIRGLNMASKNAQDSVSLIQTAEGALTESHAILQRMRELAVQSTNDTNTDKDRGELQNEVKNLIAELDRIGNTTEFNTKALLNGSAKGVAEEVKGSYRINNNSALTFNITSTAETSIADKAKVDGAYMIIRTTDSGSTNITESDFTIVKSDGTTLTAGATGTTNLITLASGSITLGTNIISSGTAELALATGGNLADMKVGESITLVFSKNEAAETDLDNSIMTQIGANSGQTSFISISDMRAEAIGVADIDISTKFGAATAIETVNNAVEKVSRQRSALGAMQNRLEHTTRNLDTAAENLQASEARIRDVDMAKEMMEFTKQNILQQAATAMLAQANQAPQSVLQLLR